MNIQLRAFKSCASATLRARGNLSPTYLVALVYSWSPPRLLSAATSLPRPSRHLRVHDIDHSFSPIHLYCFPYELIRLAIKRYSPTLLASRISIVCFPNKNKKHSTEMPSSQLPHEPCTSNQFPCVRVPSWQCVGVGENLRVFRGGDRQQLCLSRVGRED
jgi:hypothetical protein